MYYFSHFNYLQFQNQFALFLQVHFSTWKHYNIFQDRKRLNPLTPLQSQTYNVYLTLTRFWKHFSRLCLVLRTMSTRTTLSPRSTRRMTGVRRRPRCCPRERAKCRAAAQTRSANDTNAAATTAASTPASSPSSRHQVSSGAGQFQGLQKWHGCMGACVLHISPYLEAVLIPIEYFSCIPSWICFSLHPTHWPTSILLIVFLYSAGLAGAA